MITNYQAYFHYCQSNGRKQIFDIFRENEHLFRDVQFLNSPNSVNKTKTDIIILRINLAK
jgi:hypothetical protein